MTTMKMSDVFPDANAFFTRCRTLLFTINFFSHAKETNMGSRGGKRSLLLTVWRERRSWNRRFSGASGSVSEPIIARTNVPGLEGRGHRVEGFRFDLSRPDPASGPSKSRHRGRHSGRSASETRDGFSRVVGRGVTKRAVAKRLEWMRPSLVAASPYS